MSKLRKGDLVYLVVGIYPVTEKKPNNISVELKEKTWKIKGQDRTWAIGQSRTFSLGEEKPDGTIIGVYNRRNIHDLNAMIRHHGKLEQGLKT